MLRSVVHAAAALVVALVCLAPPPAAAYEPAPPAPEAGTYDTRALVAAGHELFGEASAGLATAIEGILARFGRPNGYIIGEEASGAIFGGLRYGEGILNSQAGREMVFWQGPSLGWDIGGTGARVMMLVYDLPTTDALMQRFTGVDGSAYFVSGLSVTVMAADTSYLVQVRTGVGARLGFSLGYLKFTQQPTWNPF